jgi:hypothetical protein
VNLKKFVEHQAPEVNVVGGEYPAPKIRQLLSQLLSILQFGFVIFVIMGEQIFAALGRPVPQFYEKVK